MVSIKAFVKNHPVLLTNFSYITVLQLFLLLAPLITFPYLVKVLGKNLYGIVLTAQMLASYASLIIDFGSNSVCAKHVSINRSNPSKLSEIVCSVLFVRFGLWITSLLLYVVVVVTVPLYRDNWLLFLVSYGLTLQELLFPQFFFQGIEKMKFTTFISVGIRLFFIVLVFFVVKGAEDVLWVPILYSSGYLLGGLAALYIIFIQLHISFRIPKWKDAQFYVKDSFPVFSTDLICSIKDKFNFLLMGGILGPASLVIYDLGAKINGLLNKPTEIIRIVLFPGQAKSKDTKRLKRSVYMTFGITFVFFLLVNAFLPLIIRFFIQEEIDTIPIRLFIFAPLILSISVMIAMNFFVAHGYNKYMLYSIIVTTLAYIALLLICYFLGVLNTLYAFIIISLASFIVELIYRLYAFRKITKSSLFH